MLQQLLSLTGSGLAYKLPATTIDPLSYLSRLPHDERCDFLEVSPLITDEVIKISAMKVVGYDGVSMTLINDNRQTLSSILTCLINTIARTSKFPDGLIQPDSTRDCQFGFCEKGDTSAILRLMEQLYQISMMGAYCKESL